MLIVLTFVHSNGILVQSAFFSFCFDFKETTILQLQAPQLEFLLEDLSRKLQHSLSASASSRRTFLKVSVPVFYRKIFI